MLDEAVIKRLRELLAFYSGAPESQLGADSRPENTAGWDSVANLGLLAAVEEEFDVSIGTRDAIRLRSLGEIARFVDEKRGGLAKASGDGG